MLVYSLILAIFGICNETVAGTFTDGAENGTAAMTFQTSPGYNPVSSATFADGPPHSFHFAHPDNATQSMRLNTPVVPVAGTVLTFKSRLGWAGVGQTARIHVSTNAGASWVEVYSQSGTNSAGELSFTDRTVNLSPFAGQTTHIRFTYTRDTSLTTFSGTADSGNFIIGWFVDLIQVLHPGTTTPVLSEGGENGLSSVDLQTSSGYNPLSTVTFADGPPHSFHFAHPDNAPQSMRINSSFIPQSGSLLSFKSRLGWAGVGQSARVQVSTNGGTNWVDVYAQNGSDSAGELTFNDRTVSLAPYAGQTVVIRFLYVRDSSQTTFSGTADSGQYVIGWFVDLISITNVTITGTTPQPPAITQASLPNGVSGIAYSVQISASNTPTSFAASGLPAGLSVNSGTGVISGIPTGTGTFNVTLSATNSGGTGSATLALQILPPAPQITSPSIATATVGLPFAYQIAGSNSPTSFTATGLPQGLSVSASGAISGTPMIAGDFAITISAANAGGSGSSTLTLSVAPAPLPVPQITSGTSAAAIVGQAFSYQITASNNPTGFAASGLPAGFSVSGSGVISGIPSAAGNHTVTLSASNSGGTGTASLALTIHPAAPAISSSVSASATRGQPFSYQIRATNSPTSLSASGLVTGLSVDASGLISGTPTAQGVFNVTLSASNAGGTGTATLVLTVNPPAPVISSAQTIVATKGQFFSFQILASDAPTSFGANGLPTGLGVNAAGLISGVPAVTGVFPVTISATNAGGTGFGTLEVTVNPATPLITSALSSNATKDRPFSYQIVADNAPAAFSASGLPEGLSVNTQSGLISGTPTATGVVQVTIGATNITGTGTATLVITTTLSLQPPSVNATAFPVGTKGVVYGYQIAAANNPTSYGAVGLPSGLSVNQSSGLISGTPTAVGQFSVTVTATNEAGSDSKTLSLEIRPPAPVIGGTLSGSGPQGSPFSYQIVASNGPTSFSAVGLPSGLSLNESSGAISGIPITPGSFNVAISASNAGGVDTETLVISITEVATTAPLVVSVAPRAGGAVTVGFEGTTNRTIGSDYSIVATPAAGFVFSGWSGGMTGESASLTFAMREGLVLQANFVPDPALSTRGEYNGLAIAETPSHPTTGIVKIQVGLGGRFSGKLVLAGIQYAFAGSFGPDGVAVFGNAKRTARRFARTGASPIELRLHLEPHATLARKIGGSLVENGTVVASIEADQSLFTDAKNPVIPRRNVPAELLGNYTLVLPATEIDGSVTPKGHGWARASVGTNGAVRVVGSLADGRAIAGSSVLAQDGSLPLYVPLYRNGGAVAGTVSLPSTVGGSVSGDLVWFRPAIPQSGVYSAGWLSGISISLNGSRYVTPTTAESSSPSTVSVSGGDLPDVLRSAAVLSNLGVTLDSPSAIRGFTFTTNRSNGVFNGKFVHPVSRRTYPFRGVVLQNGNSAAGYFTGPTESGAILVEPDSGFN